MSSKKKYEKPRVFEVSRWSGPDGTPQQRRNLHQLMLDEHELHIAEYLERFRMGPWVEADDIPRRVG